MIIQIINGTETQWYGDAIGQKFYAFEIPTFPHCYFVSLSYNNKERFELIVHKTDCKIIKNGIVGN